MATIEVVFWFSNKMVEKLPEIELKEIQVRNAEKKNMKRKKKKRKKLFLRGSHVLYMNKATGSNQM